MRRNARVIRMSIVALLGVAPAACDDGGSEETNAPTPRDRPVGPWFVDVADDSGLDFVHRTGATGEFRFPEITGSGGAFIDHDGDGDLDVLLLQGASPAEAGDRVGHRLFRNDGRRRADGSIELRFTDVTEAAGVGHDGYGMGCATGDYDADGDLDLYVTHVGANTLFRNEGDGTFTDVSDRIPAETRWSTSAVFIDYDRDGALDLFVTNYVEYAPRHNRVCHGPSGLRDYCGPQVYDPMPDRLFRNRGDGTFEDVTAAAGLEAAYGSGLGVVEGDFNGDGWPDLYVANDGNANQLWINRADPAAPGFTDEALLGGAAYNADGQPEAGMGVSAGDFDGDGDEDLFLAHLRGETNTLLVNDGSGMFADRTDGHALGAASRTMTGFGAGWADLDHDGVLDLFVANGAVKIEEDQLGDPFPYGVANQVFRGTGGPSWRFEDVSRAAGAAVTVREVSRGAAFGDVDDDGDVDVLVTNANGRPRLLRNEIGTVRAWVRLLLDDDGAVGAPGARVAIETDPDAAALVRRSGTGGSYCSANDHRLHVGLGDRTAPVSAVVTWPDGTRERFDGLAVRREHRLRRGAGSAP